MSINGRPVSPRGPRDAINHGVMLVTQQLSLAPDLTVAENIMLTELCRPGRWNTRKIYEQAEAVISRLISTEHLDLRARAGDLSTARRQMVEVAKALAQNSQIILFDEPTSALTPREVERLFDIMQGLAAEGKGLAFVSHRLEEIFNITDKVTVLRDGLNICRSVPTGDLTQAELIRLMIGRELGDVYHRKDRPACPEKTAVKAPEREIVLHARGLSAPPAVRDVSFCLRRGEILGLAGLVGAGRSEVTRLLFGLERMRGGTLTLQGLPYVPRGPAFAYRNRLALIPEDRKNQGVIADFAVWENITLSHMAVHSRFRTGYAALRPRVHKLAGLLGLPPGHLDKNILNLSGGQQQKAMVSRVLLMEPCVLIVDEPTQGVDIGTRSEIYAILRDLADTGMAVLFVSSDFEEILGLCHRVVVLAEGRVVADVAADLLDEEKLTMFAAPRTSAESTHQLLKTLAEKHPQAVAYWVYIDGGLVYCFNLVEGDQPGATGFTSGQVVAVERTCLRGAPAHGEEPSAWSSVGENASLLVPMRSGRGQHLGYAGLTVPAGLSAGIPVKDIRDIVTQWKHHD